MSSRLNLIYIPKPSSVWGTIEAYSWYQSYPHETEGQYSYIDFEGPNLKVYAWGVTGIAEAACQMRPRPGAQEQINL